MPYPNWLQQAQGGLLGTPDNYGGLLADQELQNARQQGLQSFAASLLQASGPSRTPTSFGQALGGAMLAGQQGQQAAGHNALQTMLLRKQLTDVGKKDLVTSTDENGNPIFIDAKNAEGKPAFNVNNSKPAASLQEYQQYIKDQTAAGQKPLSFLDFTKSLYGNKAVYPYSVNEVGGVPNAFNKTNATATPLTSLADEAKGKSTVAEATAGGSETGKGMAQRKLDQPTAQTALNSSSASLDALKEQALAIRDNPALARITGVTGKLPDWPGSDAADVRAQLKTLKAKTGFTTLQSMRDASKTGGALGNVSEREGEWLQNAMAALETAQSRQAFINQLNKIIDFADSSKARLKQGYDLTYGGHPSAGIEEPPPKVRKYNPATGKIE